MNVTLVAGVVLLALSFAFERSGERSLSWFVRGQEILLIAEAALATGAAIFAAVFIIAARLVAPPGAVTVDQLQFIPGQLSPDFRYRVVTSERELRAVVVISDNEFGVVARHPTLFGDLRHAMYKRWWRIQPNAFLILDRFDHHLGYWLPFALTIILPLTETGQDFIISGKMRLDELDVVHIERGASKHFLIEAWIMRKRNPLVALRNPTIRPVEQDFAKALLFVHLGRFHSGDPTAAVTVFVDTSTPRMKLISAKLGFTGMFKSRDGSPFQRLSLPDSTAPEHVRNLHQLLYAHVRTAGSWPLFRETTTEPVAR